MIRDVANVNVVAVVPYIIMKTAAMGRGKAKDAYDIYFIIKHYIGGVKDQTMIYTLETALYNNIPEYDPSRYILTGRVSINSFLNLNF